MQRHALNKFFRKEGLIFEGQRVLDIGCGRGRWLFFYEKKHTAIYIGVEWSKDAVQVGERRRFKVCQGSIAELPFEDMSFNLVNSTTVLMHLPYGLKEKAIAEISRVLKPTGKAILIEGTWEDPSTHVYGLDTSEWEQKFRMCNMRLVHKSGHCFNLSRIKLPSLIPFRDFLAIHLDYPLEYVLMGYFYGKESEIALQHLMVFEK